MKQKEFLKYHKRRPFVPLRIHMMDGASYDIMTPEAVTVLKEYLILGPVGAGGGIGTNKFIFLANIVRVEKAASRANAMAAGRMK